MIRRGFSFFLLALLVLGVAISGDGTSLCSPDVYIREVTHTSIVSVTSTITSFSPYSRARRHDVTFTQTNTVWTTTTTTLDQTEHAPPAVMISTTHLVSTAHVTVTNTIKVCDSLLFAASSYRRY